METKKLNLPSPEKVLLILKKQKERKAQLRREFDAELPEIMKLLDKEEFQSVSEMVGAV